MHFLTQEEELSFKSKIQSLYFYASWMPYHKKMLTMIDKVEQKHKEIQFFAIDTDHFTGLCKRFNVESIPCVVVIQEGKEVNRVTGLIMTSAFRSAFVDICKV
jgi:thioredoxin-like negative regulator of GroEL